VTFNNIINGTTCDCLKDTFADESNTYARVLNKETLVEKDFLSKWDKGRTVAETCEEICGDLKCLSVSKVENDAVKQQIVDLYSQIMNLAPKYKRGVLLFKFKVDSGVLKYTPDERNKYHHDFYKSDGFTLEHIEPFTVELLKPADLV
jgi:hypothetical protein